MVYYLVASLDAKGVWHYEGAFKSQDRAVSVVLTLGHDRSDVMDAKTVPISSQAEIDTLDWLQDKPSQFHFETM